jgi:PAS domain S-box-containing protein
LGGLGPGLLATALGALAAAFVFFRPHFSFAVDDPTEVLAVALFGGLGAAISLVVEQLQRREWAKRQADEQALLETADSLRESRERLRAVVETAGDAILTIDERGRIDSVNPAAERMFGYSAAEMIGHNVNMLMPFPYRDEHDGFLARYLRTGEKRIIGIGREVQGRHKDGTTFPLDLAVSEFWHRTRPMFTGVLRDISARKRLEREVLEAATEGQRRIGQALHDSTGQELTALGLLAEALAEGLAKQAPEASPLAAKVVAGLRRVLAQVRDYSRGLIPVEVDSRGLLAALSELAARTDGVQGVRCRFDCPRPVAVEDNQAATQLYHIAQEAVTNALRHGRPQHITIRLKADENSLTLEVSDDGTGLPPEPADGKGMGLKIMHYRAGLINARLAVRPLILPTPPADGGEGRVRGALVTCTLSGDAAHGQDQDCRR